MLLRATVMLRVFLALDRLAMLEHAPLHSEATYFSALDHYPALQCRRNGGGGGNKAQKGSEAVLTPTNGVQSQPSQTLGPRFIPIQDLSIVSRSKLSRIPQEILVVLQEAKPRPHAGWRVAEAAAAA